MIIGKSRNWNEIDVIDVDNKAIETSNSDSAIIS